MKLLRLPTSSPRYPAPPSPIVAMIYSAIKNKSSPSRNSSKINPPEREREMEEGEKSGRTRTGQMPNIVRPVNFAHVQHPICNVFM
ncbi:hypothetical protein GWI33_017719 [Rhynchophorus ferrugineus]|uniref:Uncharacterized protein n=1 Tax=Rhynchophorus ferrugineus TaxID=354439 RepID=A0A834M3H8_RHYFE|nr:hypothetical protein GWI33_017719 [Rhynchophorus ferrugineus]